MCGSVSRGRRTLSWSVGAFRPRYRGLTMACTRPRIALLSCARLALIRRFVAAGDAGRYVSAPIHLQKITAVPQLNEWEVVWIIREIGRMCCEKHKHVTNRRGDARQLRRRRLEMRNRSARRDVVLQHNNRVNRTRLEQAFYLRRSLRAG